MTKRRLLTEKEKMADDRFDACIRIFPEFDCYSDGTYEINEDKIPPGFAALMKRNKEAYEANKELLHAAQDKFSEMIQDYMHKEFEKDDEI